MQPDTGYSPNYTAWVLRVCPEDAQDKDDWRLRIKGAQFRSEWGRKRRTVLGGNQEEAAKMGLIVLRGHQASAKFSPPPGDDNQSGGNRLTQLYSENSR